MSKREQKLIDIAKRFRKLKYKLNNFYQYQMMVNYKHVLLIGDTHSNLGKEIIKTFGKTWQIGNIGNQNNEQCQFNLQLNFNDMQKGQISQEQIQSISDQVQAFSKHYECILCIPPPPQPNLDIKSESIFEQIEDQSASALQSALLTSYLATKFLINNGTLMYLGDTTSFSQPTPQNIPYGMVQEQLGLLNVSLGDREYVDVDSCSLLLLPEQIKVSNINEEQPASENINKEGEAQKNEEGQTTVVKSVEKQKVSEDAQIAKYVKQWADGIRRPISGTFIKFPAKDNFLYPELL